MLIQTIVDECNTYFQNPDHDTILWFDPQGEWRGVLPHLASQLPLLIYEGSQLRLRYALAHRQPGARAVVYLPLTPQAARYLRPYFYTAKRYQPTLAGLLRDGGIAIPAAVRVRPHLLPALAVASVGKGRAFWTGIVNLKTAFDRLVPDFDGALLRFLDAPQRALADLNRRELRSLFFELVADEFGIAPPAPGEEAAWADRFTAHLCLVEAYAGAGQAEGFPFREALPPPVHWARCRSFLQKWQHHELFKGTFGARAKAIDAHYPLGAWVVAHRPPAGAAPPTRGALLNVARALWEATRAELAALESKAAAVAFARAGHERFQAQAEGFWAREGALPGWRALALMAQVLLGARDALDELARYTTASAMIERYSREWWKVDRDYRRFRVTLDQGAGGLDPALKWTSRLYHDFLAQVNAQFTAQVTQEGTWPPAGQRVGAAPVWDRTQSHASEPRALVMVDALRYELAQDLARRLELAPAQVDAQLSPVPSVTALGMAALLPGWPNFCVDYAEDWVIAPPQASASAGSTTPGNLATKSQRLAWLLGQLGKAAVYDLDQWLSTPFGELQDHAGWIVVTALDIDAVGEGAGTAALHTFDALLDRLEGAVRRLLAVGCTEVHVLADHGFLLREAVRESDKVKVDVAHIGEVLKKRERYLVGRDLPPTDLPHLPVSGSAPEDGLVAWFPRGIGCFVTPGPYNYMHGGIALQEVVVPHLRVQQTVAERLVGVALELVGGPEIRNAIFKVRLVPQDVDLLTKPRQVEIDVVKAEQRVSRVWEKRVQREVLEPSLMLEPDYGLQLGDEVRIRVRDATTGELLAERAATVQVDLEF